MQQTDVSSVVVLFQAAGALMLALIIAQLGRIFVFQYARMWALGWASVAVSLFALRIYASFPHRALLVIYIFGHWLFVMLLLSGCREASSAARLDVRRLRWMLIPVATAAVVAVWVAPTFDDLFMVKAAMIAIGSSAAFATVTAKREDVRSTGRRTLQIALALFALLYAAYVPLFFMHTHGNVFQFLTYSALANLLASVFLGCAMILVTAEAEKRELNSALSALAQAQGPLEHRLQTDPLTEVFSRHAFHVLQGGHEVATEGVLTGTVVMIDVDNLKTINDEMGHAAGDVVIRAAANAVRILIRADDLLFRWGGDEFVAILPNMGRDLMEQRFLALESGMTARSESGFEIPFSVSYGAAEFGVEQSLDEAIKLADAKMYDSRR
jgi:diguanylate cyclase (GGDEF)-like protein